jgi:hypothetical protein
MRSIEASYRDLQIRTPNLGACICLAEVVKRRKFSRKSLVKAFNELVPVEEYAKENKKALIDYLEYLTNLPVEGEI